MREFKPFAKLKENDVERLTGTVAWFNNGKGFGFVSREGGPDVFCHFSSIESEGYKSLKEGDKVEFSIVQGDRGKPQTEHVIRLGQSEHAAAEQGYVRD